MKGDNSTRPVRLSYGYQFKLLSIWINFQPKQYPPNSRYVLKLIEVKGVHMPSFIEIDSLT